MFCEICNQDSLSIGVHVGCKPNDNKLSCKEFNSLRDKKHFTYKEPYNLTSISGFEYKCRICETKFKLTEDVYFICISNKFKNLSDSTWSEIWAQLVQPAES